MANQIQKSGAFPAVSATYQNNYQISDVSVGKFISLTGAKKFYSPGIGLLLQSPNSGSTVVNGSQTFTVQAVGHPNSQSSLLLQINLNQVLSFNLTVTAYLNYLSNGLNGGTAIQTIPILSGQSTGSVVINAGGSLGTVTNISPVIVNILSGSTSLPYNYGNTNAIANVSIVTQQTVPTAGAFTNTLNIPDFNISSINFYGAGRDTLILVGNKLTGQ